MKNTIIIVFTVFNFGLLTAQNNLVKTTNKVIQLNPSNIILDVFGVNLRDFTKEEGKTDFDKKFTVNNKNELLGMFSSIVKARKSGLVAANIWDGFGVGRINKDNLVDAIIDIENFIGELPGVGGKKVDMIGSEFAGKRNRPGSGYRYNKGVGNDFSNPNSKFNGGGRGQQSYGDSWGVNATHSSYKNHDENGTTSFVHHHDSVSNDNGYSSETDKQTFTRPDGSSTTRIVVTQTQADGSSKNAVKVIETDSDGNSHTTTTYTEKNSDGEVIKQKTTEKDDDNYNPEDPEGYYDTKAPPSDEEIESAVWNAVVKNCLAGCREDDRTGQNNRHEISGDFSPQDLQNQKGYMEKKSKRGMINKSKINKREQVTNPGVKKL